MKKKLLKIIPVLLLVAIIFSSCASGGKTVTTTVKRTETTSLTSQSTTEAKTSLAQQSSYQFDLAGVPAYSGKAYIYLNGNKPVFSDRDYKSYSYEYYGKLDRLQRCTACIANIGKDLMPTEKRGSISEIHPTGWQSVRYDNVDGGSLYNRCHLIGYQLTGENANAKNLITGTRYLNVEGMLPFEEKTASYIKSTGNHVLYRVTPVFKDSELVARGVQMEGISVEDNGKGICFNVYCYNVQPGIEINYTTGASKRVNASTSSSSSSQRGTYILNQSSKKFHKPDCPSVETIKDENKKRFSGSRDNLIQQGYKPCGSCKP